MIYCYGGPEVLPLGAAVSVSFYSIKYIYIYICWQSERKIYQLQDFAMNYYYF